MSKVGTIRIPRDDFERITHTINLTAENHMIARRVLVDGERPGRIAAEYGKSKNAVNKVLNRVRSIYLEGRPLHAKGDEDWITIVEKVPPSEVEKVRAFIANLQAQHLPRA